MLQRLARGKVLHPEARRDLARAESLNGENLGGAHPSDMRGQSDREQERLLLLECELTGREQTGQVAGPPGIGEGPGRSLAAGCDELFDLAAANRLAFSPGGELLELARERHSVVAHELHERTRGFGVGRDPHACELSSNPRLEIARLRNVV